MLNCIGCSENPHYKGMNLVYASNLFVSALKTIADHLEYQIDIIGGEAEDISPFYGGNDIYVDCRYFKFSHIPERGGSLIRTQSGGLSGGMLRCIGIKGLAWILW